MVIDDLSQKLPPELWTMILRDVPPADLSALAEAMRWHPTRIDTIEVDGGHDAWSTEVSVTCERSEDV